MGDKPSVRPENLAPSIEGLGSAIQDKNQEQKNVLQNLLDLQAQDQVMDSQEKGVFTRLLELHQDPAAFSQVIDSFVLSEEGKIYAKEKDTLKNLLFSAAQKLDLQSEAEQEAVMYSTQARMATLKESIMSVDGDPIPQIEHKRNAPDPNKMAEHYQSEKSAMSVVSENGDYIAEKRGGAIVLVPVQKTGGDWMSRMDGSTLVAGVGTIAFSLSALASMSGGGNSQALALASGALLSANYVKNQVKGEVLPGESKVKELSDKYKVDENFVDGMVDNYDGYMSRFGKNPLGLPGEKYMTDVRKMNWQLFDAVKGENLYSALRSATADGQCWDKAHPFTPDQKIAWFEDFLDKNNAGNKYFMEQFKTGGLYENLVKEDPSILDNFYSSLWYLDERGVYSDNRKNAFKGVGRVIDESLDKSTFHKMFQFDMFNK